MYVTRTDSFLPLMTDPLFISFSFLHFVIFSLLKSLSLMALSTVTTCPPLPGSTVSLQVCAAQRPLLSVMQSNPDGNWLFCNWMLKCIELETKISLVNLPVSLILQAVHGMFPTVHSRHQPNPITPVFTPGYKVYMYLEGTEVGQKAVTHAVRFRDKFLKGEKNHRNLGAASPSH